MATAVAPSSATDAITVPSFSNALSGRSRNSPATAKIDPVTNFTGFEDLTLAVRCERARELGGEFQRKFDLVRWGIWYDQTYAYTNNATLKGKMRPCHRYYPIPDAQCALSGYVLTNDEYLADGL